MKRWQGLNKWQKGVVGLSLFIAWLFMPELMFFFDLGGIELLFGFMVLYFQSIMAWFDHKLTELKSIKSIVYSKMMNSILSRPKVLSLHAVYCFMVFTITGSLLFSMSFLTPAFFIGIENL